MIAAGGERGEVVDVVGGARDPVEDLDRKRRELREEVRVERHERGRSDDDQRGGLADGPRQRQDHTGGDARDRGREHLAPDGLPLGGAEGHGALADRRRHGADGLAPGDDHHGQHQQPQRQAAGQHHVALRERAAHEEGEAEDPVDDRRHRGQVLDVHLDRAVVPALAVGVLLEVDRRGHAHRHDEHRDHAHQPDRAQQRRADAGVRGHRGGVVGDEGEVDRADAVDGDVHQQRAEQERSKVRGRPSRQQPEGRALDLGAPSVPARRAPDTELIRRPACTCARTGSRSCS